MKSVPIQLKISTKHHWEWDSAIILMEIRKCELDSSFTGQWGWNKVKSNRHWSHVTRCHPDWFCSTSLWSPTTTAFIPLSLTWNRGCESLPSSKGCGPAFLHWMGATYKGRTRAVGGPEKWVTGQVRNDIASSFCSFFFFLVLTIFQWPPTGLSQLPCTTAIILPRLQMRDRQSLLSRSLTPAESFFLSIATHLHICSTRCADFTCSSPFLACKCKSEDFCPMRGV